MKSKSVRLKAYLKFMIFSFQKFTILPEKFGRSISQREIYDLRRSCIWNIR